MAIKPCSRCKIVKPVEEFSADKRAASGRQPACKQCHRERTKELRRRDLDANRAYQRDYYAKNADKYRAQAAAWRDANREEYRKKARATYERRREKHIASVSASRKKDPQKLAAWARTWRANRRARVKGGATPSQTRDWMNAQKKVCYWCAVKCPDNFHVDHYVPLVKGGKHELTNLVIACPRCNLTKNSKDPLDFAREVGRLL